MKFSVFYSHDDDASYYTDSDSFEADNLLQAYEQVITDFFGDIHMDNPVFQQSLKGQRNLEFFLFDEEQEVFRFHSPDANASDLLSELRKRL